MRDCKRKNLEHQYFERILRPIKFDWPHLSELRVNTKPIGTVFAPVPLEGIAALLMRAALRPFQRRVCLAAPCTLCGLADGWLITRLCIDLAQVAAFKESQVPWQALFDSSCELGSDEITR